jgi:hypothetical protein
MFKAKFKATPVNIIVLIINMLILLFNAFAGLWFIGDFTLLAVYFVANIVVFIVVTFFIDLKYWFLNLTLKPAAVYYAAEGIMKLIYILGDAKYF